jgi:regulator of protease activity HflC (stomatin/prohibitin superfamily)
MSTEKKTKSKTGLIITASIVGAVGLTALISSMTVVPAGHTGVKVTLGEVSSSTLTEGFHLKTPFVTSVIKVSNKIQKYESDADAVSKDLQSVSSTIAVNYRLAAASSANIYQNIGLDYENILIAPAIQEAMKASTSQYTAEELITRRTEVGEGVKEFLNERLNTYGVYVEKFNIVNFDFSSTFNEAIEQKQVAEQNLLRTRTEQEQEIVKANAEAEKKKIAAEAEANKILTEANAQAEANRKLEESLSEKVLKYKIVENWDGVYPKVVSNGNFMFDIGGIEEVTTNSNEGS